METAENYRDTEVGPLDRVYSQSPPYLCTSSSVSQKSIFILHAKLNWIFFLPSAKFLLASSVEAGIEGVCPWCLNVL